MKKLFLLVTLFALIFLNSCKKDDTEDLTLVVWWDETTAINLELDNITTLYIYIDDDLVGTESTNYYFSSSIDCDAIDAISKTYTVDNSDNVLAEYAIKDQFGNTLLDGTYNLTAYCNTLEFVY